MKEFRLPQQKLGYQNYCECLQSIVGERVLTAWQQ